MPFFIIYSLSLSLCGSNAKVSGNTLLLSRLQYTYENIADVWNLCELENGKYPTHPAQPEETPPFAFTWLGIKLWSHWHTGFGILDKVCGNRRPCVEPLLCHWRPAGDQSSDSLTARIWRVRKWVSTLHRFRTDLPGGHAPPLGLQQGRLSLKRLKRCTNRVGISIYWLQSCWVHLAHPLLAVTTWQLDRCDWYDTPTKTVW